MLGRLLDRFTDFSDLVISAINLIFSFTIVSLLFAAIYKLLPNIKLLWRDVIFANCGTVSLFEAGQTLIGYFLANFITANINGAASGIIVLLIWVYYSAQVFFVWAQSSIRSGPAATAARGGTLSPAPKQACSDAARRSFLIPQRHLARGSGRSWKCTILLVVPLPPSI